MTSELERKLSLFEIEQSLSMLMQDRDEVTDPEEIAAVDLAIRDYVSQEIRKVDGIRAYIRHSETMAAAAKEEASRAASVAQAWQSRVDRLKASCLLVMQEIGTKRLDGKGGYLVVKGNGGVAPLKIQEDVLPDDFRDVTIRFPAVSLPEIRKALLTEGWQIGLSASVVSNEPSNSRIREALKIGGAVPGAWLEERGQHIEVK